MITCSFEDKGQALLRHVTVNALVLKDNQILLGKRGTKNGKPILESGKWGLLGGYLGRDENLIFAVKREVMEESGWEIDNMELFRINDNPKRPNEDRQNVDIIFIASTIKQIKTSDEEVKELRWFNLNALPLDNEFAFDHKESIDLYIRYKKGEIKLPILG